MAGFSSCWGLYLFEPGKLDPRKMTLTWKVVLVPGEGNRKLMVGNSTKAKKQKIVHQQIYVFEQKAEYLI